MDNQQRWDGDVRKLPAGYIGSVLQMLDKKQFSGVRFGVTGKGNRPNYQLVRIDGSTQPMSGQNHQKFRDLQEFEQGNISELYSHAQLTAILLGG